ncbi:vacuolar fusion protein MON1 homolog B isoform X1 [Hippopotamus amphibius kiboko]|uniref:vacuolar fusion protein MON1 homolog B isoform X1 n=1 Tax=Hippopotamus amphibius kiboko TaxID=575201 RepID=UPI002597D35F|nr:vacuolar fusion protein MON1 homolog B isoform X1 [Hippopotamus amphibius kiboko]XP_057568659.1 vacuolar fusion protein MON1 homolog B isoform X1 [Hippopotamus amphibius kiboko]XP_057568660.1 vacuolar fusion protein MON1 homolog B isoform X1 [Hippopotamus amphibius kiboko]XP_057568661.1 vacuolar fusion protein MON1 homolog B isoform X1 [Hippopotamus amphibius kiboko]
MEAGGDTAAPAPGDAEDLEEMRFPSEEARDGGGVHKDLPDPGDASVEKTGSETKDQPPGLLLQSEAPSCTYGLWGSAASESSPMGGPESGSGGQGGDPSDEDWRSKRKHVFVLSEAGKPIYSRYGSVEALSTTMGVMTALVSFVQSAGDAIRAIYAEDHKLVFLQQGPLLLVAVSRTPQSAAQLRGELLAVHAQIVSTLTRASVARIFARKQNYDLRRLLAGSERTLDRLLDSVERDPGTLLLGAVRCVPLARPLREALGALLRRCTAPGLALSVLAVGGRLVTAAQERTVLAECRLDPADLQLLLDWVGAPAFAAGEAWAPVCLPRFNPDGFFYAYVARLDAMPVCLLLLGTDPEAFHDMATCRRLVEDGMHSLGAMRALREAASFSNAPSANASAYSVQAVGAPGLRHFLYKPLDIPDHHRQLPQFTSPELEAPYSREEERQRLSDLYHRLHARLHNTARPLRLIYHVAEKETLLAWVTSKFELYTCLSPLVTKAGAILVVTKLLRWVKKEEDRLFIRYPPKYSTPAAAPAASTDQASHNGLFTGP